MEPNKDKQESSDSEEGTKGVSEQTASTAASPGDAERVWRSEGLWWKNKSVGLHSHSWSRRQSRDVYVPKPSFSAA